MINRISWLMHCGIVEIYYTIKKRISGNELCQYTPFLFTNICFATYKLSSLLTGSFHQAICYMFLSTATAFIPKTVILGINIEKAYREWCSVTERLTAWRLRWNYTTLCFKKHRNLPWMQYGSCSKFFWILHLVSIGTFKLRLLRKCSLENS